MKTKHDLILDFLFEINGQFEQNLYESLELFFDYSQKWHSVEKTPPPFFENVIIQEEDGDIKIGHLVDFYEEKMFMCPGMTCPVKAIAWRPISFL